MAHAKNQHSFISFDVLAAAMRFCVFLSFLQKMSDMQFLKLNWQPFFVCYNIRGLIMQPDGEGLMRRHQWFHSLNLCRLRLDNPMILHRYITMFCPLCKLAPLDNPMILHRYITKFSESKTICMLDNPMILHRYITHGTAVSSIIVLDNPMMLHRYIT